MNQASIREAEERKKAMAPPTHIAHTTPIYTDMHTKDIPLDRQEQLLSDTKPIYSNNIEKTMNSAIPTDTPEMPDCLLTGPDTTIQDDIDLDHSLLTFGKYRGQTPSEVAKHDPHWLVWAFNNVTNRDTCSKLLANECEKAPRKFIQR